MKITNKYNLPIGLVKVVEAGAHPPKPNRYSVTDLIGPPLIRSLKLDHWDKLESDVSEYLWMLLGTGVDQLISGVRDGESIRQCKIEITIEGFVIVGVIDVINGNVIADWKCTSVYSYIYGLKDDWLHQLNMYDYMLKDNRKNMKEYYDYTPIEELKIYAILRDWQNSKKFEPEYPKIPFVTIPVPKWGTDKQEQYIIKQLNDHLDNPYRECTSEEKWQSETTYAVKKKYQKKALRVLKSQEDAEDWIKKNKKGDEIEVREGECRRCKDYCPVRSICKYA